MEKVEGNIMEKVEGKRFMLGLDVSSKTIGICLLEDDGSEYGKVVELTHISPKVSSKVKGIEQLFLKKRIFGEWLSEYKGFGIKTVVIEEPLLKSNNVFTVSTLLRFNGMISDCIYETLGIVPEYISSYDARAYCFPELMSIRKFGKDGSPYAYQKVRKSIKDCSLTLFGSYPWEIDKKSVLHGKVSDRFPDIEWMLDKKGELKKENFDAVDSYVALAGWLNRERYGELVFGSTIRGESCDGNGHHEIVYDVTYWGRTEERKTFVG